jgi:hypothetical protein
MVSTQLLSEGRQPFSVVIAHKVRWWPHGIHGVVDGR